MLRPPSPAVTRVAAAAFGLILAAGAALLVAPVAGLRSDLAEGDYAPRTFEAAHDAQFVSEALTEAAREQAAAAVQDVPLPPDPALTDARVAALQRYLASVRSIVARTDLSTQQKADQVAALEAPGTIGSTTRLYLISLDSTGLALFESRAADLLRALMSSPIGRGATPEEQQRDIAAAVEQLIAQRGSASEGERAALSTLLRAFAVSNFRVDAAATERARQQARDAVSPVVRTITAGQVIVTEGQRITAQEIEALRATGTLRSGLDPYTLGGAALIAAGFGLLLGLYAYLLQPFESPANRRLIAAALTILAVLLGARVAFPVLTPDAERTFLLHAIPVSTAAIVVGSFARLSYAAVVAAAVGIFAAFIGGSFPQVAGSTYIGPLQSLEFATVATAGGLAGAAAINRAERINRYALAGIAAALATAAAMASFWLFEMPRANIDLAWIGLAAGIHGAASAVLGLGIFALLAFALGITSRIQLLELAQPEHPLLRRLQEEAPGTYHHSMLVGSLAERAAIAIGADPLLARVGAYYHDIGKLAMPRYYIENMLEEGAPSPHDGLPPEESARIIRAHVTNGLELARKHRLPDVIRDFIPQHHGTRLVSYFYRTAVREGRQPDPADFRYEGPRPQSREAAIVMLADSCEAVIRAGDHDPAAIDQSVDAVIAERLAEGQFDECDITMRDLQAIARTFKATFRAVYHPRVRYPQPTPEELASVARGETPVRSP
ncbi:HDIG domain-containing protein [Tepidiforma flava]|uniref:HDIG domain-containing protein n=1 Tax=Tepidiforma flava TaxID=3004094 RepID=A0ABY7M1V9_9CHLR|nr:HDIG domain-containing metalloprotein [Tepidiforma flava]WBL34741.1 HDIG domain-containing protein [Tepidiforma flava]